MRKTIIKPVIFFRCKGKNCRCSDCPVLYGGDCPYDSVEENKKPRLISKKVKVKSLISYKERIV